MGRYGFRRLGDRVSTFLHQRPFASFLITTIALILEAGAIRRVITDEGRFNGFTWAALGVTVYATIAVAALMTLELARIPRDFRLLLTWAMGIVPALSGFAAILTGSPAPMMWIGIAISFCLLGWTTMSTVRAKDG